MRTLWYRLDDGRPRLGLAPPPPRRRGPRARSDVRAGDRRTCSARCLGGGPTATPCSTPSCASCRRSRPAARSSSSMTSISSTTRPTPDTSPASWSRERPERSRSCSPADGHPRSRSRKLRAIGRRRRARHRRPAVRRGRDGAALHRDVWTSARSRRPRRSGGPDRGLDRCRSSWSRPRSAIGRRRRSDGSSAG